MVSTSKLCVLVVCAAALFSSTHAHTTDASEVQPHVHKHLRSAEDNTDGDQPPSVDFTELDRAAEEDNLSPSESRTADEDNLNPSESRAKNDPNPSEDSGTVGTTGEINCTSRCRTTIEYILPGPDGKRPTRPPPKGKKKEKKEKKEKK
jgi:hypothetical protein